jgi:hypothetical protein
VHSRGQHATSSGRCASDKPSQAAIDGKPMKGSHQDRNLDAAELDLVPPLVKTVLRSGGQPLDPATRATMERQLGHDFTRVRIHADAAAIESARLLAARAYTCGDHVVLAQGISESGATKGILAHELVHVVQQSTSRVALPELAHGMSVVDDNSLEREADEEGARIAHGNRASGRPNAHNFGPPRIQSEVIQLDRVNNYSAIPKLPLRTLTPSEEAVLDSVFGPYLDTSLIRIAERSVIGSGSPRTIGDTIYIPEDRITTRTLVHEAAHCYQTQRGDHYIASSLSSQLASWLTTGTRRGAYDYSDNLFNKIPFDEWNSEQQADWIRDYRTLPPSRKGVVSGYP